MKMDQELLINEVAKYPAMFDVQCAEYSNRMKKEAAWAKVSSVVGFERK